MSTLSAICCLVVAGSLLSQCSAYVAEELKEIKEQLSSLDSRLVQQRTRSRQENDDINTKLDLILYMLAGIQKILLDEKPGGGSQQPIKRQQLSQEESQIKADQDDYACRRRTTRSRTDRREILVLDNVRTLCDLDTDCGGWVVIQRREKGDVNFYRNWAEYKNGFGTPHTDYWLGLDSIHKLTREGYTELRIDLRYKDTTYFAHYFDFKVGEESSRYQMTVGQYYGTAGDSLKFHNGSLFSTSDMDNDKYTTNCAEQYHGAWWYANCYHSNLNGLWGSNTNSGVVWRDIGTAQSLSFTEMKLRRPGR